MKRSNDQLDAIDAMIVSIDNAVLEASQVSLAVRVANLMESAVAPTVWGCSSYCSCDGEHGSDPGCCFCECQTSEGRTPERQDLYWRGHIRVHGEMFNEWQVAEPSRFYQHTIWNRDAAQYEWDMGIHHGDELGYGGLAAECLCGQEDCPRFDVPTNENPMDIQAGLRAELELLEEEADCSVTRIVLTREEIESFTKDEFGPKDDAPAPFTVVGVMYVHPDDLTD